MLGNFIYAYCIHAVMKRKMLFMLCLLFILSGCGETIEIVTSDIQTVENIAEVEIIEEDVELEKAEETIDLREIEEKFNNYDARFHPRLLLNMYVITETTQGAMKEKREELRTDVTEALAQNTLGEKSYMMDSCLTQMETYEAYIAFVAEEYNLSEELTGREVTLWNYVNAYEFNDSHAMLAKVRETLQNIIKNLKERKKMNIEELPNEYIEAWQAYYEGYEEYDEFIELWHDKSYTLADEMYEDISKEFGDANMVREQRPMSQMVNSVELWYNENVGVCIE